MEHCEDDSRPIRYLKINGVGEGVQQCSANFARHGGELVWLLAYARKRSVDIAEEAFGEPGPLIVVPPRGILEIGLGERPNDEPADHSQLALAAELLAKTFLDDVPVVAGVRIDVELLHALVDDLAVPVGNREGLRRGRDSVPQRLQVIDFFVDRQVIETRRREWNGFRHGSTSSPAQYIAGVSHFLAPACPRASAAACGAIVPP
jgi:hypothetical protein